MNPSVVIKTNFGDIGVELFPEAAPKSVSNFLQYAFDDYYDNVLFHRVIDDFVIQAGLFSSEGNAKTSSLRAPIELESNNGLSNLRGTIGFARTDAFDSATSQFYFNLVDNTSLDYQSAQRPGYTVFGQITSGLSVIDAISSVAVATNNGFENVPIDSVVITDIALAEGADQFFEVQAFVAGDDISSARLEFTSEQIRVKELSDGSWAVLETGGWSIAKLVGYERVLLNDKAIGLDLDGSAGQAYRVYKAAFDRDPMQGDTAGLGFWIAQIDNGMDMVEVAARFIDSNEFRTLYGANASDGDFLIGLYRNVLDRAPDAGGYAWWIDQLANNPEKSWEKVLADFSESPENQANVAELIAGGIYYDPWVG
jgi:cyclophilin family peptidyl-prolyl cis-trans isomerase